MLALFLNALVGELFCQILHQLRSVLVNLKLSVNIIEAGDKEAATKAFKIAVPAIDSSVSKGIMHKNKAARSKSRLNARIQAM